MLALHAHIHMYVCTHIDDNRRVHRRVNYAKHKVFDAYLGRRFRRKRLRDHWMYTGRWSAVGGGDCGVSGQRSTETFVGSRHQNGPIRFGSFTTLFTYSYIHTYIHDQRHGIRF